MATKENLFLEKKIAELPFSDEFKALLMKAGYSTLGDLLEENVAIWVKLPCMKVRYMNEVTGYVKENNLQNYFKEI